MFVRSAWYLAGFAEEIEQKLQERTMLAEPIVLFRNTAGQVIALANRCPHRFAPLSLGTLIGDRVQCAYHGIEFDCLGSCVHIPGQDDIPPNARVRSYPVIEKWGCIWIWMGDPLHAREEELIDGFHYLAEPGWRAVWGKREVKAGYELVIDNLLDLTHIAFLHPNTLGNRGDPAIAEAEPTISVTERSISVERVIRNSEPAPLFTKIRSFEGRIDRYQHSTFIPPCFVLIELRAVPTGTQEVERGLSWRVFHVATPVSATETRYHWAVSRPFATDDEAVSKALWQGTDAVLGEDQWMIEAQARMLDGTSLDERTLYTRFDAHPAHARRIIRTMIRREATAGTASTVGQKVSA